MDGWNEIADKINSTAEGPQKNGKEWSKVYYITCYLIFIIQKYYNLSYNLLKPNN